MVEERDGAGHRWGVECWFEGGFCFKRPGHERVFEGRQDRPVEGELVLWKVSWAALAQ